jgi:hypothetical protein
MRQRSTGVFLAVLLPARALPVEPHSCSLVEIVHTNLTPGEAAEVQSIYSEVTSSTGTQPEPVARRLSQARGGFWDAYFMGAAFSYSVHCSEYVELASEKWNVLLCRESEDDEAYHCGSAGLTLYSNGTMSPRRLEDGTKLAVATPSLYHNYLLPQAERAASEAARMPELVRMIGARTYDELQQPSAADALRRDVERALRWAGTEAAVGALWNVLIEREAGGHYYYSEEQFNLEVKPASLTVAVFDRRCRTLQLVDGRSS